MVRSFNGFERFGRSVHCGGLKIVEPFVDLSLSETGELSQFGIRDFFEGNSFINPLW